MEKTYTLKYIAKALGLDKSNARKYAIKHGFSFSKIRLPETNNQRTLCLARKDFDKLVAIRNENGFMKSSPIKRPTESGVGWFYIIQLLPDELPNRLKLGYTSGWEARMQAHKITCPHLKVLLQHKVKETWEKAIIDMLSCVTTKQHTQELFDVKNANEFIYSAKKILKQFPKL